MMIKLIPHKDYRKPPALAWDIYWRRKWVEARENLSHFSLQQAEIWLKHQARKGAEE